MKEILYPYIPNVIDKLPVLWSAALETLIMLGVAGAISFVLGLALGVTVTVTQQGGILQNKALYQILDKAINFFRSIPFVILLIALIPVTRAIVGTAIGTKGVIVPLIFGTVPFMARQTESALAEVSSGLVEAAQAMGSSPLEIIFRVYLRESIAAIARVTTITFISLLGLTAMAGAVGGGGLGDFAIRYGQQRNQMDVTYITVLIIIALVSVIQLIGNVVINKNTH